MSLPPGWSTSQVRRVAEVVTGKIVSNHRSGDLDTFIPFVTAGNIQPSGHMIELDGKFMWYSPEDLVGLTLSTGDLVIVEGGAGYGRPALVGEEFSGRGFQNHVNRVRARAGTASNKFLYYAFESFLSSGLTAAVADGATLPTLSAAKVRAMAISLPPTVDEQRAIADFLDRETAKIDALIDKQTQMINLLRERRSAAWSVLLDVPSVSVGGQRLKHHISSIRQGWSPQCNNWPAPDDGWAVLKVGCVNGGLFRPDENKELPDDLDPRPETVVRPRDLIISRANTRELVGGAAVVHDSHPRLMLSDKLYDFRLRPSANPDLVAMILGTRHYRDLIELDATGASPSMQNITQNTIRGLPMNLPPRPIQDAMVERASKVTTNIDSLIARADQFVVLATERRAALITAAVTGQIDVREGALA